MRSLKFKLKRKTLNQIYISYLRPILEYASIVWDNCTIYEKDMLDKIQYEAARIVTGLTRSVSIDRLLSEIGWVNLSDRRKIQKLTLVYKQKSAELPDYLSDLFPQTVAEANPYNLRNNNNYTVLSRRTEIYSRSVIPSSLNLWNQLDENCRESTSLPSFKSKLKEKFKPPVVPSYYLAGERRFSVYHARIRNRCSNLNADLFNNHLRQDSVCSCGSDIEDAEHYLFRCINHTAPRYQLFINTRGYHPLSMNKLLYGNPNLNDNENEHIFMEVQKFIKHSERFVQL